MERDALLDITALRTAADGSPTIERHLLLLFIEAAERCLAQLERLVVRGSQPEWNAVLHQLKAASLTIHARPLATLCSQAVDGADDAASRMTVYLRINDAYGALWGYIRKAKLLTPPTAAQGGS